MARVDRRRRDDPRGRRRPRRPGRPARAARGVRRPAAADRLVLAPRPTSPASSPTPHGISTLLHEHGALAFWDFAAAAPYVDIEMTAPAEGDPLAYKDAIFLSPHKFIGGPVDARACSSRGASCSPTGCRTCPAAARSPTSTPRTTRYLADPAHREEGGTPAIIESIRAGLVFQLKEAVGVETIRAQEERLLARAVAAWQRGAGDRDPRQPRRRRGCRSSRSWCGRRRATTCTTTSSSRCSTTCSASSPAAAARAPAPTATGCSASTSSARTSSSARSPAAARASSPAGCGSTSTTSSPTPSPTTSSRPCASSPATAGGCSATTASTRSPASGGTATGWSSRRSGCATSRTPTTARCVVPRSDARGGEDLLAEHLRDGAAILAAAAPPDLASHPADCQRRLRAPALVRPAGERHRPMTGGCAGLRPDRPFRLPTGDPVPGWTPRPWPPGAPAASAAPACSSRWAPGTSTT